MNNWCLPETEGIFILNKGMFNIQCSSEASVEHFVSEKLFKDDGAEIGSQRFFNVFQFRMDLHEGG